jgi:hypothetical protein
MSKGRPIKDRGGEYGRQRKGLDYLFPIDISVENWQAFKYQSKEPYQIG